MVRKQILVTGASRGIGKAIVLRQAKAGADIIGVASSLQSAEAVRDLVEECGVNYSAFGVDLANLNAVEELCAQLSRDFGVLDGMVLAAGMNLRAPVAEFTDEAWKQVMAVNLDSVFVMMRELGRPMALRGNGAIVVLASLLSFQGGLTVPAYAASKSGVAGLVKSFANEWAAKGVNVNAVAPGYVATDMNAALLADETRQRQILERIPAGRWAKPEDIAGAVAFLLSDDAAYVHGVTFPVDGGWLGR